MADVRDALAVVLGIALGVVLIVAPRTVIRLSVLGGQRRRRGEYGSDGDLPDWWAWVARALGVACLAVAAVVAYQVWV